MQLFVHEYVRKTLSKLLTLDQSSATYAVVQRKSL